MIITGTILTDGLNFKAQQFAPNAPTIGTITILSNTSANVRFTAPSFAGHSQIIGYTAIAFPGGVKTEVLNPNASNITITGLSDNTYYTFSVTANNSEAPSANSVSSVAMLTDGYPPAPAISYAVYTSNTTANIVYTAPTYNGNSVITSYTAVSNVGGITATVSTANSGNILVTNLPNNITYGFTVYATNQYGSSVPSNISNGIFLSPVIFTPPGAPTILYAQARDGVSANIVYTSPISNGNSAITSYTARSTPGNVTATGITEISGNINIGGLSRNTTYTFTVTANNAIGTSANSAISNSITTPTVPDAPIMATWEAADGAANIGYTAPTFNGNSPITSYTLTTVPENRTVTRQGVGNGNISITGLDYNTTYVFAVYATNLVGSSILSSFSGYLIPTIATDPYFRYVTLLLSGDGTNNANNKVFVDSSINQFPITRNGDTTPGTFAPYGTKWSNYFDGSSYMYPDSAINTAMGTGFAGNILSFEMWIYPTNFDHASYAPSLLSAYAAVAQNGRWYLVVDKTSAATTNLVFGWTTGTGTQTGVVTTTSPITRNQWNHVVATVDATTAASATIKLFVNGVLLNTFTGQNMSTQTSYYRAVVIGGAASNYLSEFLGYISDLRILKGSFAYTDNYTVPTAPLTAITNTVLLTCQSNRFKDNSANNFALTLAGTPAVYKFSPYAADKSYPADVYGGSAYFDGSGDYLSFQTNQTPLALSNSDWTVEAWVYRTSSSSGIIFIGQGDNGTAAGSAYIFYVSSSATSDVYGTSFSGGGLGITSPNPPVNTWAHVAWCRTGGTYSSYLNGVRVGTNATLGSNSINVGSTANAPCIGSATNGVAPMQGYISNLRLIKGSGGYDATQTTLTIPTSPLTAITNTSLLCNFTNIGVYDGSMNTNLITVGDAKISTTQSKFGGSSMAFDGTGDFVTVRGNQQVLYSMGTANFTIEMWVYTSSVNGHLIDTNNGGDASGTGRFAIQINSSQLQAYNSTGTTMIIGGTINTNQWHHIAYARASGSSKLFIDGEQVGSTYTDTNNFVCGNANRPVFGVNGYDETSTIFNGYIDDLRITRGIARYTTNFGTPQRGLEKK